MEEGDDEIWSQKYFRVWPVVSSFLGHPEHIYSQLSKCNKKGWLENGRTSTPLPRATVLRWLPNVGKKKPAASLRRWEFSTHRVSIRAVVQPLVEGSARNLYKGFATFKEAISYLKDAGHTTFHFHHGLADGPKPTSSSNAYYAVIIGREPHIQRAYR